jgi:Ser/Thr protein kinase RdoA (MazF antagonist)
MHVDPIPGNATSGGIRLTSGSFRTSIGAGVRHLLNVSFNIDTITAHLFKHYGIEGTVSEVSRGRATNYRVRARHQSWLWKVFQPELSLSRITQAADVVAFVTRAGYPAREYVRAADGRHVLMFGERAAVLIPWIEGATPEPNQVASVDAITQIGRLCGEFHHVAAAYPVKERPKQAGSGRSLSENLDTLARLLAQHARASEIGAELAIRLDVLSHSGLALEASRRRARLGLIHGDFQGQHVVFDGPQAVGVIDVLGEWYVPGWEMMRAFFQSVPLDFEDDDHEALLSLWRGYLDGYRSAHPIRGDTDIEVAYDVYLFQVTASTYGLRPPLDAALREFGRWRTRLAQYLHHHRANLRTRMASA